MTKNNPREVESLTACGFDQRIPDAMLDDCVGTCRGTPVAELRRRLHAQVRTEWRSKSLAPVGLAHEPHAQGVHPKDRQASAQVRAGRGAAVCRVQTGDRSGAHSR
jgi:hypothetical protein